ncbi:MAG: extracellular solute-binding protein [Bacilli bacterium]|nr:extracellular solute-binding protein [Bacilli bacterium]
MKKNKWFALGLLLIALASCASGEGGGGGRNKVQKIKFLHIWSESASQFTKICNDFMSENEDIQIETIVSDYTNVPNYLNSQIMSRSLPDVFFYWSTQVAGYVQAGACLPLDDYMANWADTFRDVESWDLAKVGGKHYSVPFRCTGEVVVYNKTLFDEQNLVFPTDFQGFEDLLVSLRKISSNPSFSPIALTGINGGTLPAMYTAFQNFGELITHSYEDPNFSKGLLIDSEENRVLEGRMLDKLKDLNSKGYFGQADGKTKDTSIRNFMEGNAAMLLLNNNNLYLLDELEGVELGFASIPAPRGLDYTYVHSDFDGFSIAKQTKYPDACVRFLKYLTSKDVSQYFSDQTDSVMAAGGVEYKNAVTQSVSAAMKDCGKAVFAQNDKEYSTTNIDTKNNEAILNYILGKGRFANGKEVADYVWSNNLTAINDAGLTAVEASVAPQSGDFSWLDIRQ